MRSQYADRRTLLGRCPTVGSGQGRRVRTESQHGARVERTVHSVVRRPVDSLCRSDGARLVGPAPTTTRLRLGLGLGVGGLGLGRAPARRPPRRLVVGLGALGSACQRPRRPRPRPRRPPPRRRPPAACGLGRLGGLHRGQLLLGRQLAALGDDERLHLGGDVLEDLDRDRVAADALDRRRARSCGGRRGSCASRQISSAMSVGVTEPKSEPVGPAFTSKRSSVLRRASSAISLRLLGRARLVARALRLDRASSSATRPGVADLGEPAREQVVAGVAARDVDDVAAQAELLDVAEQDDLHRPTPSRRTGSSAISRARLTATATWRWWRRHAPVMRR